MANRYWIGNGGDWSDTAHWSTSSGGSGGASAPYIGDTAIFDANSFSLTGQIVTATSGINATTISSTATNSPTISLSAGVLNSVYGSMDWTGFQFSDPAGDNTKKILWTPAIAGTYTLTTGGASFPGLQIGPGSSGSTFVFGDDCTTYSQSSVIILSFYTTTINLNGKTLTCGEFLAYNYATITTNSGTISTPSFYLQPGVILNGVANIVLTGTASVDGTTSSITMTGSSTSSPITLTNNSGSTIDIVGTNMTNTTLNGTNGFRMVDVTDGGGNGWGGGGGGGGTQPKRYYVKNPPTYIGL